MTAIKNPRSAAPGPKPRRIVAEIGAYAPPHTLTPTDLRLDGNEGAAPDDTLWRDLSGESPRLLKQYPAKRALEAQIARRLGVALAEVLVTAGADDAIDRTCRAFLEPGKNLVHPTPTFEMLPRYAQLAGATCRAVPWPSGPYPTDAILAACDEQTAVIAVVSPNNPTGAIATADDLRRLAQSMPHALLLVDLAYGEFADVDLTPVARELPNAITMRTLSKAWGLAGLRVGYAVGQPALLEMLFASGSPYSVAAPSLALAAKRLATGQDAVIRFVAQVREDRQTLTTSIQACRGRPQPSQANFVFAQFDDAAWIKDGLAGFGIAVRSFPEQPGYLRITCPGDRNDLQRLVHALQTTTEPEAILFDLDGVLANVSDSYRAAIMRTADSFGVCVTAEQIQKAKIQGNANNDWELTHRLIADAGVEVSLAAVTEKFETLYQGTDTATGLRTRETLLVAPEWIAELAEQMPLGIVTGRPRADAKHFLQQHSILQHFSTLVCMEDGPLKPDPAPIARAMKQLDVRRAWMLGDTPDDIHAARGAQVLPVGVIAPQDCANTMAKVLLKSGAARVISNLKELPCPRP